MRLTAWRIVPEILAEGAFTGDGARQFGGRWNSPGRGVVYASAHQSLAALEILVHLNPRSAMRFKAFQIHFDEGLVEQLADRALPAGWRVEPPGDASMRLGDEWLRSGRTTVLAVPSAIIPQELNYLLNPAHADFRAVKIAPPLDFAFDPRLLV